MISNKIKIVLNNLTKVKIPFQIKPFLEKVFKLKNISQGYFEISLVNNKFICQINNKFLNHANSTDIITFNLAQKSEMIMGDIYISLEQAQKNALRFNNSFEQELKLLLIHGILHLLDYLDYTESERALMRREEKRLLELANK